MVEGTAVEIVSKQKPKDPRIAPPGQGNKNIIRGSKMLLNVILKLLRERKNCHSNMTAAGFFWSCEKLHRPDRLDEHLVG